MNAHSRYFSPSALARRIACPASAIREDGLPNVSSPYASWGTAAHKVCERCFREGKSPMGFLGQVIEGEEVTQEMVAACQIALTHLDEVCGAEWNNVQVEIRLDMPEIPGMFGTADLIQDEPFQTLTVLDYKFGQGIAVSPVENPALMAYALMAAGEALPTYQTIRLAISQPRISEQVQVWETTPSRLARFRDETLLPLAAAIQGGNPQARPSADACRWCRAASSCPEYTQTALQLAKMDFAETVPSATSLAVTPELVQRVYPQLGLLEDFIERVKVLALELAQSGNLPGYKAVEGRGRREWTDEQQVIALLQAQGQEPFESKLISPAKAEKLGKEVREAIKLYIKRIPGPPTIAPEGDKRPALATATQDFAAVSA